MASGLDTDSLVKSLIRIEQLKVDRVAREKTTMEWKKESLSVINQRVRSFSQKYTSVLSADNLFSANAFKAFDVNLTGDTSAVSIRADATAVMGRHTMSVQQLATSASAASSGRIAAEGMTINRNVNLATLSESLAVPLSFGGVNSDTVVFKINDVKFSFGKDATLNDIINNVNFSSAGINMSFSSLSGKIIIRSKTTGADSTVNIENISGNAFGDGGAFAIDSSSVTAGKNALATIDGYSVERSGNTFSIDGLTYNLIAETTQDITMTVSQNINGVVDKVKNFVSDYNALVEYLNDLVNEKADKNYGPLSDAQREDMSETDIEKWEKRAKLGLMRNDRNIRNLLQNMREMLFTPVEGVGRSLADIGLKTGAWFENGKIAFNEDIFKNALQTNPDEVSQIFTRTTNNEANQIDYSKSGFLPRLSNTLSIYARKYNANMMDQRISTLASRINEMQSRLLDKEQTLYNKYSALESYLTKMQSQSSWLSQQTAGM